MTSLTKSARRLAAAGLAMGCASAAVAGMHTWSYTTSDGSPPLPGGGSITHSSRGGSIHSLAAGFDDATSQLSWSVSFRDRVTEGFYLVLTDGAAPTGRAGQFGVFYFDAYSVFDPDSSGPVKLTAYGFNGQADHRSWRDGDASAPGDQPGDCIKSALDTDWVLAASASDVTLPDGTPGRSMGFTVNASGVIGHSPAYGTSEPWRGTGFGDLLGVRLVPAAVFEADYDTAGRIGWLSTDSEGAFDGRLLETHDIPGPGTAAIAVLGVLTLSFRRRRPVDPVLSDDLCVW